MLQAVVSDGNHTPDLQPFVWEPPPLKDSHKLRQIIRINAVCGRIIVEQRERRSWWDKSPETHVTNAYIIPATVKAVREADSYATVTRIVPSPQRADFERAHEYGRVDLSMAAVCHSKRANFRWIQSLNPWAFGRE